jgi:ribosomal protein S12 methylthiotransferase accessory factor
MTIRAELRPLRGGHTHVTTPTGRTFRVKATPEVVWQLLTDRTSDSSSKPEFEEVLRMLDDAGIFGGQPVPSARVVQDTDIHLIGDSSLRTFLTSPTASGAPKAVLGVYPAYQWGKMLRMEGTFLREGHPYAFAIVDRYRIFLGPVCSSFMSVRYRDIWDRMLCAAWRTDALGLSLEPPLYGELLPDTDELRFALDWARNKFQALLKDGQTPCLRELDFRTWEVTNRIVRPMPNRALSPHEDLNSEAKPITSGESRLGTLVDARIGIVTKVEQVKFTTPGTEKIYAVQAWAADMRRVDIGDASPVNAGFSFQSSAEAETIAIAETIERYCANYIPDGDLIYGSAEELRHEHNVIDISRFALFADEQHSALNFPFRKLDEYEQISWTRLRSLTDGSVRLAPASLTYLLWNHGPAQDEQPHHPTNFAGVSTGTSMEGALTNALEEIVERDAMMRYWLAGRPARKLIVTGQLATRVADLRESGYECWFLALENEFRMPVAAAVILETDSGVPTVGYAARNNWNAAARKAWSEAIALQESVRDLQRHDGLVWKGGRHRLGRLGLKPLREDRRYADDYAADFADVASLFAQLQINLDPRVAARTVPLLRPGSGTPVEASDEPRLCRSAVEYARLITGRGHQIYYKDLTTQDVMSAGIRVVRALVPELLMNFPTAYPPLGSVRLWDFIKESRGQAASQSEINYLPLPYA